MNYIYIPTLNAKYYPISLNLCNAELNEELQHVEAACEAKLAFEPTLFQLMCTQKNILAQIKRDEDKTIVFTGVIKNNISCINEGYHKQISN